MIIQVEYIQVRIQFVYIGIIIPNGTHYSANWCKNRVTYHLARVSIMVYFYIKY